MTRNTVGQTGSSAFKVLTGAGLVVSGVLAAVQSTHSGHWVWVVGSVIGLFYLGSAFTAPKTN